MSGALQRLKKLDVVKQRRASAILGALLADAASCPLHWIYDQNKVLQLTMEKGCVEFYPQSKCPFYTVESGSNSTYGDQLYVTLKSIAENKGFDTNLLADALFKHFGPGTIYEDARQQSGSPVKGPWTNHCLKIMIANRENGQSPEGDPKSQDPDGLCKAIALVCLLGGTGDYSDKVEGCVQTAQLNTVAVDFATTGIKLLDHVIKTGEDALTCEAVLQKCAKDVVAVVRAAVKDKGPHSQVVKTQGLQCSYPVSFYGAIHGINGASGYEAAVKAAILAGGDNCSRVVFMGAYCAAKYGLESIPEAWLKKYPRAEEVLGYIESIIVL